MITQQQPTAPSLLVNKQESARLLGISVRKLDQLIAEHDIAVRKIGKRVFIHRLTLEQYARGR